MSEKKVNALTRGFLSLSEFEQKSALVEFWAKSRQKEDWFYSLLKGKVFAADNGEGGYTLMLAEEY
ncbi:MAG: hypothetical protein ABIG96_06140 [Candidatus Micrarchaeota archaeon]